MKAKLLTLLASLFLASAASAQSMNPAEILSAIDGEFDHVADANSRVNFDMSTLDTTGTWHATNAVLSGIDGEYSPLRSDTHRVNYSVDPDDLREHITHDVLSGIDGEYEQ